MWMPFAKPMPIAVDVGGGSVRALQLELRNGRILLRHWLRSGIRSRADNETNPMDEPPGGPGVTLNDEAGFYGRDVALVLSPPDVECIPLRVPNNLLNLEHANLLKALTLEVARHVKGPLESFELDAWKLVPGNTDGPNVMVAAAPKTNIQQLLEWVEKQGYRCRRIDLGPLAALRACVRMTPAFTNEHIVGVLDVGLRAARLYIGVGEVPVYVRRMLNGGEELTRRIAAELGVAPALAEKYKRHYGIQAPPGGYRPVLSLDDEIGEQRMSGILLGVLQPIISSWGEEIKRSFQYVIEYYPNCTLGSLVLVGGEANLKGLEQLLGQMLGIKVNRLRAENLPEHLAHLSTLPDEAVAELANPLGLCLGEAAA